MLARTLTGGAVAVAAFGAVVAFPRTAGEGRRAVSVVERAPAPCAAAPRDPDPAGLVEVLDSQLLARMPQLEDPDRRELARTIAEETAAARIDPLLVLALISVESAFDPGARSGRGARGLMQLRDATMRREAQRAGLSYDDPHDPVTNVQAGVRYLRRLLDAFGREEVALMAYNAGPNRILGYLRGGEVPDRFRVYPRRVRAELHRLRRSVGVEPAPALATAAAPGAARALAQ